MLLSTSDGYGPVTWAYDSNGRNTSVTEQFGSSAPNPGTAYAYRSYDADDHMVSQSYSGSVSFQCSAPFGSRAVDMCPPPYTAQGTLSYSWGPEGHIVRLNRPLVDVEIHWDGDSELFDGTSSIRDFDVGNLGVYGHFPSHSNVSGNAFVVEDRDMSGTVVAEHSGTEFSAWSDIRSNYSKKSGLIQGSTASKAGDNYFVDLAMQNYRTDGYADQFGNVFQGARTYDDGMQQWTTPDLYGGSVHDQISQKPFVWNHNDPMTYSDPTGYYVFDPADSEISDRDRKKIEQWMRELDEVVEQQIKDIENGNTDRVAGNPQLTIQILEAFHQDLQEGQGGWVVDAGALGPGELANTSVEFSRMLQFGDANTVFDVSQMEKAGTREALAAIATEGGTYGLASGAAGETLQHDFLQALHLDKTHPYSQDLDLRADQFTNMFYSRVLGLPYDNF